MKHSRKSLIFCFFIFVTSHYLHADLPIFFCAEGSRIEFRTSFFYPTSSNFRKIFSDGGTDYQLTGSLPIFRQESAYAKGINLWGGVDYFSKTGRSAGLENKTRIQMMPVTLGLKYFSPAIGETLPFSFYAAAGMKYYFIHTHNSGIGIKKAISRNGMGGVVEAGCLTFFDDHLFLDLFVSYSFKSFYPPSLSNPAVQGIKMDVSGINVGTGIGYHF